MLPDPLLPFFEDGNSEISVLNYCGILWAAAFPVALGIVPRRSFGGGGDVYLYVNPVFAFPSDEYFGDIFSPNRVDIYRTCRRNRLARRALPVREEIKNPAHVLNGIFKMVVREGFEPPNGKPNGFTVHAL